MPIVTIEEAMLQGGFGSFIIETTNELGFHEARIDRIGIPDKFIEHGNVNELLEEINLTTKAVVEKVTKLSRQKEKRA
jgi:1-deoxy-D-xylulose-5-phosphate synthase